MPASIAVYKTARNHRSLSACGADHMARSALLGALDPGLSFSPATWSARYADNSSSHLNSFHLLVSLYLLDPLVDHGKLE